MNLPLLLRQRAGARFHRQGMTLVELMLSVAIVAVLVAVAVPSMYEFIMRKKVEGAADELMTDMRYARSALAKNNRSTLIKFGKTQSGDTCYVIYHPTGLLGCDCTSTPVCTSIGASSAVELKTMRFTTGGKVSVQPVTGSRSVLVLEAPTGLPVNGSTINVSITAPSGGELRLSTTPTGRAQLCAVSGHDRAYPACSSSSSSD